MENKMSEKPQPLLSPIWQRRIKAFAKNKRAVFSLFLFLLVFVLTLFSEFLANDKPLIVKYKGDFYFPIVKEYDDLTFGGDFPTPADYKDYYLIDNINKNGWMVMPPIPFSFNTVDYELTTQTPAPPSAEHWLGTDDEGRDIVARILYGVRLSVVFAFVLTTASSLIGIVAGAAQGYFGGKIDIFFQRFQEVWEALPQLFILIIIASIFVPTFWTLLLILLLIRVIKVDHIREKADFLLGNLGFFFVPATVGIMNYADLVWENAAAFFTICVVSMVVTYGVTVWTVRLTSRLLAGKEEKTR